MDDHLARWLLPDGRELTVYRYIYNDRVVIGPPQPCDFWAEGWCFIQGAAVEAVTDWDGTGDPPGPWIKNLRTNEHGPGMALL